MPSSEVMHKWKTGVLHSGGPNGPVVKSRAQAIAIKMSEAQNEAATGSPDKRSSSAVRKARSRRKGQ